MNLTFNFYTFHLKLHFHDKTTIIDKKLNFPTMLKNQFKDYCSHSKIIIIIIGDDFSESLNPFVHNCSHCLCFSRNNLEKVIKKIVKQKLKSTIYDLKINFSFKFGINGNKKTRLSNNILFLF